MDRNAVNQRSCVIYVFFLSLMMHGFHTSQTAWVKLPRTLTTLTHSVLLSCCFPKWGDKASGCRENRSSGCLPSSFQTSCVFLELKSSQHSTVEDNACFACLRSSCHCWSKCVSPAAVRCMKAESVRKHECVCVNQFLVPYVTVVPIFFEALLLSFTICDEKKQLIRNQLN